MTYRGRMADMHLQGMRPKSACRSSSAPPKYVNVGIWVARHQDAGCNVGLRKGPCKGPLPGAHQNWARGVRATAKWARLPGPALHGRPGLVGPHPVKVAIGAAQVTLAAKVPVLRSPGLGSSSECPRRLVQTLFCQGAIRYLKRRMPSSLA